MDQIDIKLISTFLNIISRRLINLSAMERPDDFSSQALLNLAMSETSFSFVKIAEEELRLAANDLDDLRRRIANGLNNHKDKKDPEWVQLF